MFCLSFLPCAAAVDGAYCCNHGKFSLFLNFHQILDENKPRATTPVFPTAPPCCEREASALKDRERHSIPQPIPESTPSQESADIQAKFLLFSGPMAQCSRRWRSFPSESSLWQQTDDRTLSPHQETIFPFNQWQHLPRPASRKGSTGRWCCQRCKSGWSP